MIDKISNNCTSCYACVNSSIPNGIQMVENLL